MIDFTTESPITLAKASRLPELARDGRKPHIATLFRWTTVGCRGVRLEAGQVGNSRCTSREAVGRFLRRLNGEQGVTANPIDARQDADAAERELAATGF